MRDEQDRYLPAMQLVFAGIKLSMPRDYYLQWMHPNISTTIPFSLREKHTSIQHLPPIAQRQYTF